MNQNSHLTISEFARLTGIKRANLIFYDKIGLLSPEVRADNGYRFYSRRQLGSAYLIADLRGLGIGLDEIRQYAGQRTPEKMMELFALQEKRIKAEMTRLKSMHEMMELFTDMAKEALEWEDTVGLCEKKAREEPVFLGMEIPEGMTEEAGIMAFYDFAESKNMGFGYPLGAIVSGKAFEQGETDPVLKYYFRVKYRQNAYKPEGCYAVALGRCVLGQPEKIYGRLMDYIKEHDLVICGDLYEEYPLNEVSIQDEKEYCVKIEIPVKRAAD